MPSSSPTTIITGITRGIGFEMARHMATSGQRVITLGRQSMPELQKLAAEHGTDWSEILVDLSDRTQTETAGQALIALLQDVQQAHMVLNAGTVNPILPADQHTDLAAIETAFDVNIVTPIYLTGCFLSATQSAQDRRIMMISSGAGRNASHSWGIYCATKAAMDRYAEAVKIEAHPNLRIASVAPGIVDTPMQQTIRSTPEALFPQRKKFEDFHRDGALASPQTTARNLLALMLREDFGDRATDDVRQHTF
jgi:benzil reductase ((S)-benzoin forming)